MSLFQSFLRTFPKIRTFPNKDNVLILVNKDILEMSLGMEMSLLLTVDLHAPQRSLPLCVSRFVMQRTSPRFAANEGSRPDYRAANTHGFHHLPPVVEVVEEAAALPSPNQHSKVGEEVQPARVPGEHHGGGGLRREEHEGGGSGGQDCAQPQGGDVDDNADLRDTNDSEEDRIPGPVVRVAAGGRGAPSSTGRGGYGDFERVRAGDCAGDVDRVCDLPEEARGVRAVAGGGTLGGGGGTRGAAGRVCLPSYASRTRGGGDERSATALPPPRAARMERSFARISSTAGSTSNAPAPPLGSMTSTTGMWMVPPPSVRSSSRAARSLRSWSLMRVKSRNL